MNVRYYIENNSITGLMVLLTRRQKILASVLEKKKKTEGGWVSPIGDGHRRPDNRPLADRVEDAWRDEVARFWIGHPILSQFTKKELNFNLGSAQTVQIVSENPQLMLSGPRVLPDYRVDVHHSEFLSDMTFRVCSIEFEHIEFERLSGEADPRGTYFRACNGGNVYGVVGLQNGKYRLMVQLGCQLDDGTWIYVGHALELMMRFALDIIHGELQPDNTTASG